MFGELAGFDYVIKNSGDVINIYMLSEIVFVNERESEAINGSENISVFVDNMSKGSTIRPFFGFAMARGDVTENDAWFVHGSVDRVNDVDRGFEIAIVVDSDGADVGAREESAGANHLTVHSEWVMAIINDGYVHRLVPK